MEVPAGNETDPVPPDTIHALNLLLDPIVSTTLEIGTKQILEFGNTHWGGTLVYDVAIYWLQVTNDIIPYRNGRFYFTAGVTQRRGAECGATAKFTNGLSVDASLTLSDNRYAEYRVDSVYYSAAKAGIFADFSGNEVAGIPSVFYSSSARYAPAWGHGVFVRIALQGTGKYFVDDPNRVSVPSWLTINVSLGVERLQLDWGPLYASGFLAIQNIADAKYIGSAWINPDLNALGKPMYIEPGLPRSFLASLTLGAGF